jgi:hypothetical protein
MQTIRLVNDFKPVTVTSIHHYIPAQGNDCQHPGRITRPWGTGVIMFNIRRIIHRHNERSAIYVNSLLPPRRGCGCSAFLLASKAAGIYAA